MTGRDPDTEPEAKRGATHLTKTRTSPNVGADRESEPLQPSLIGFRTALLLFALLLTGAAIFLKGNLRIVMVVVILGLVAKSVVHHLRTRLE